MTAMNFRYKDIKPIRILFELMDTEDNADSEERGILCSSNIIFAVGTRRSGSTFQYNIL